MADGREIVQLLESIKLRYMITRVYNARPAIAEKFQNTSLNQAHLDLLRRMLGDFKIEKQFFEENFLEKDAVTSDPFFSHANFFLPLTHRKSKQKNIISDPLQRVASELLECMASINYIGVSNSLEKQLSDIVVEFEQELGKLSDNVAATNICSTAFSLAHYMERMSERYRNAYIVLSGSMTCGAGGFSHVSSWMYFYLRWWARRSCRDAEVEFIQDISDHPECTDFERYAVLHVLREKIMNYEASSMNSVLKKLLTTGIECAYIPTTNPFYIDIIKNFCEERDLFLPSGLKTFLEITSCQRHSNKKSI